MSRARAEPSAVVIRGADPAPACPAPAASSAVIRGADPAVLRRARTSSCGAVVDPPPGHAP